jgi:hypothetical protein
LFALDIIGPVGRASARGSVVLALVALPLLAAYGVFCSVLFFHNTLGTVFF